MLSECCYFEQFRSFLFGKGPMICNALVFRWSPWVTIDFSKSEWIFITHWKLDPVRIIPSAFTMVSSTLGKSQFIFFAWYFLLRWNSRKEVGRANYESENWERQGCLYYQGPNLTFFPMWFTSSCQFTAGRGKCSPIHSEQLQMPITLWSSLTRISLPIGISGKGRRHRMDIYWTLGVGVETAGVAQEIFLLSLDLPNTE